MATQRRSIFSPLAMPFSRYQGLVIDDLTASGKEPPRPVPEAEWQRWAHGVIAVTQTAIPSPDLYDDWRAWGIAFQRAYYPG